MRKPAFTLLCVIVCCCTLWAKTPRPGRIETFGFNSRILGNHRYVRVWLPPGYDDPANQQQRYPVLYLNDGQFVYHSTAVKGMRGDWHAEETAAKLIADQRIEPIIIVALDNGGRERTREYLPVVDTSYDPTVTEVVGDRFPGMLLDEVVPFIELRFRVRQGPDGIAVGGSSFGAVAALYCALARQGKVGKLLLESPSLYVGEGWLFKQAQNVTSWPDKVYLGVGTNEVPKNEQYSREAVDDVMRFEKLLKKAGLPKANVKVVIEPGRTHNENAWADRFPIALQFLFGKPKSDH